MLTLWLLGLLLGLGLESLVDRLDGGLGLDLVVGHGGGDGEVSLDRGRVDKS